MLSSCREFTRREFERLDRAIENLFEESRVQRQAGLVEGPASDREAMARHREAMARIAEQRKETRAWIEELFRRLDRLDGGADPAT